MTTNYMVISPRYKGDKIKKVRKKKCTVGVFRVLPGMEDDVLKEVNTENVDYWAVGDSKPIKQKPNHCLHPIVNPLSRIHEE